MRRRFRKYLKPGEAWRPPRGREKLPPADVVRSEYATSHSTEQLARRWKVSIGTLYREFDALGLPRRRPRQYRDGLRPKKVRRPGKAERAFYAAERARQMDLPIGDLS